MPNAPTSKAVLAVPTVADQWHEKRVNRKLDDRDQVLEEAIQLTEEWDTAVYPTIDLVAGFDPDRSASSAVTLTIGGSGCATTDTVTVLLGGEEVANTPGAGTVSLAGAAVQTALTAIGAGPQPLLAVRINDVLCPPVLLPAVV
jgi:hypothetical protein